MEKISCPTYAHLSVFVAREKHYPKHGSSLYILELWSHIHEDSETSGHPVEVLTPETIGEETWCGVGESESESARDHLSHNLNGHKRYWASANYYISKRSGYIVGRPEIKMMLDCDGHMHNGLFRGVDLEWALMHDKAICKMFAHNKS